ncbi:MAG: TetR-like C-terminal domain-containing protein [Ornithinimicrobium sp.]
MPRAGLNPAIVAQTAAEIADADGWDHLTLATVASRLEVRQPSLYKHVGSLAALRRAVSLLALSELSERLKRAVAGRAGTDALKHAADEYRAYAHEHPGQYAASVVAPVDEDEEHQRVSQDILATLGAILRGYGITEEASDAVAVHEIRSLRALLHGFVTLESSGGFALAVDLDESFDYLVKGFDEALRVRTSAQP